MKRKRNQLRYRAVTKGAYCADGKPYLRPVAQMATPRTKAAISYTNELGIGLLANRADMPDQVDRVKALECARRSRVLRTE